MACPCFPGKTSHPDALAFINANEHQPPDMLAPSQHGAKEKGDREPLADQAGLCRLRQQRGQPVASVYNHRVARCQLTKPSSRRSP
jgi:hypothetical protein